MPVLTFTVSFSPKDKNKKMFVIGGTRKVYCSALYCDNFDNIPADWDEIANEPVPVRVVAKRNGVELDSGTIAHALPKRVPRLTGLHTLFPRKQETRPRCIIPADPFEIGDQLVFEGEYIENTKSYLNSSFGESREEHESPPIEERMEKNRKERAKMKQQRLRKLQGWIDGYLVFD